MPKNQDKNNTAPRARGEQAELKNKNFAPSISSVVKTEIYPEGRKKEPTPPPHLPYTASMIEEHPIQTDPYGSYTGTPLNPLEEPVQDVDDL